MEKLAYCGQGYLAWATYKDEFESLSKGTRKNDGKYEMVI